jgi:hypothetical protein
MIRPERTGRTFERIVSDILREAGGYLRRPGVIGRTVYGEPWKPDLVLDNAREFPAGLIVECKWQESTGSADEKLYFLAANIKAAPLPGIIVIGGQGARVAGAGARPAAIAYLRQQVDGRQLVRVLTTEELMTWARNLHYEMRTLFR